MLLLAWASSISMGYKSPALMAGTLIVFILLQAPLIRSDSTKSRLLLPVLAALSFMVFIEIRFSSVYRDLPARLLTYKIDHLAYGTNMIKTSKNIYGILKETNQLKNQYANLNRRIIILPNTPNYWVNPKEKNPISADWPQNNELGTPVLLKRVYAELEENRGKVVILIEKYEPATIAVNLKPPPKEQAVVTYAKNHFTKTGETEFFELYE